MTTVARDHAGRLLHKVTTTRTTPPLARCGLCGWSETADLPGDRAEARALARQHLRRPSQWPVFHVGRASLIGGRTVNADHCAVFVNDTLGEVVVWAVAAGIADTQDAAGAARLAADTAVRLVFGHGLGAAAALLIAGERLRGHQEQTGSAGDAVMVLAVARGVPGLDGYELAWVGDCHGYELSNGQLVPLTVDPTAADVPRAGLREIDGTLDTDEPGRRPTPLDHTVTTSVATATAAGIGTASTANQRTRLVLTSAGEDKPVPHDALTELIATTEDPRRCAHLLTLAGLRHGGTDNATALVVDPVLPA